MGTSKRAEMKGSDAPGPGGYEIKMGPDGPQYSMAGKAIDKRRSDSPGPGQYTQQGMIGKDSQGRTIGMKLAEKEKDYVPGPGQYDQGVPKDGPAHAFGGA